MAKESDASSSLLERYATHALAALQTVIGLLGDPQTANGDAALETRITKANERVLEIARGCLPDVSLERSRAAALLRSAQPEVKAVAAVSIGRGSSNSEMLAE